MIRVPAGAPAFAGLAAVLAVIVALGIAAPAAAQTGYLDQFLNNDVPIELTARSISYDAASDTYRAEGGVEVRQGDIYLRADRLLIDMKDMSLSADGDVAIGNREGEIRSPALHINFRTQRGVIIQGELTAHVGESNYYLRGQKIEKVGENHFFIRNGWYTTCDCGQDEADWYVEADEIDVTLNGYALVRRGRVYMGGLPVAYIPFGVIPAKIARQTGFLSPRFGWSTDDGYHFGIPFFWAIGDNTDATIYTDVYEKRGVKEGLEYRYALSRQTAGIFDMDYIEDQAYDDDRWAVSFTHTQNVARRLYLRNSTNMVSDNEYVVDFPADIQARYDRFLRSDTIVNNLWENFSANINFEHYDDLDLEDNSFTWQRLPEVRLDALSRRAGPLPLAFGIGTTATNFYRRKVLFDERAAEETADRPRAYWFGTAAKRLDVFPSVWMPLNFNRYAFLTPYLDWRETYYEAPDRPREDRFAERHIYTAGVDLFTRAERVWPVVRPIVKGVKHTVEPGVLYAYTPPVNQDALPIIDGEDRVARRNIVTYYLANRLWLRVLPWHSAQRITTKLLDVRVSQDFDIDNARRVDIESGEQPEPFGPIRTTLESSATFGMWLNKVVVRSQADYNTYLDRITNYNVLGALGTVNDDALGVEYRYQLDELGFVGIDYLSGVARYTLIEFLTLSYLARYSFRDDTFIERIYGIGFNSLQNCWSLTLQLEQRELPEPEDVYLVTVDLTGLVKTGTAF